jgi:DNA-binding winged helix-turn-helix (wHTH) protein/tetratricopeptide (TPR) repeat protein
MARRQHSELAIARIAALRPSICRDLAVGSMKLFLKRALTDKSLVSIGLELILNWAVLPFVAKGNSVLPGESPKKAVYKFGPFLLDTSAATLARSGNQLKLQDLPYRLLVILVERPGEIVSREEVRQRLWPQNTFVEFDNSLGVAIRKIRDAIGDNAEAPCYVETVPRRGYRFLAPVTTVTGSQDPVRPVTTEAARPPIFSLGAEKRSAISRRYLAIAVFLALLIGGIAYRFRLPRTKTENQAAAATSLPLPPVHVRRSVAVMGFRNLPGRPEDNWLSPAFAEMLSTELAADGALRLVSGEDVARAKRELPLTDEDSLAKETLGRLHTNPGADVVVLGSYTPLPGKGERRIRLDVRLQDTEHGETIAERAFVGNEDNLFELVAQAGASLRDSLGGTSISEEAFAQTRAALPLKPLAVKLYTEGRSHLWAFDFVHARDLLIQAIAVEPEFPLAHSALSDAWHHLGYDLKARDETEHARALSEHLSLEERLQIEGQYYSSLQDTKKAIEVYRKLFALFPDNLNYGLRLADEQRRVNSEDALKTLAALRRLPSPAANDPRIDIIESRAWVNQDYAKVQAAGRRAVEKGTAQEAHLLVARAYGILCQTLGNGSSTEQAIRDCQNARQSFAAAGDRNNEARTLNDFAGLYYQLGQIDKAESMFREALRIFREIGTIDGITTASSNLGDVFLARGNLASAEHALSDALPGYKEMGDKDGIALALNNLGEVARRRGELDKALTTLEQAKTVAQDANDKSAVAYVLFGRGDVLTDRGDLVAARKSYEEALAIRKQTGEKQTAAETELALARLAVEEGRGSDAETVIRKCKEQFHQDQQADDELAASIVLIDALLAESKLPEAESEAGQAKSLADKSADTLLRLQLELMSGRVQGWSGHFRVANAQLQKTLQSAHSHRLLELELETRLALAELSNRAGQSLAARAELLRLENAASRSGFGLIASKARSFPNARE